MSKVCETESCEVEIIDAWSHCAKCHRRMKRRQKRQQARIAKQAQKVKSKSKQKGVSHLLDAQGKVRANMGLSRLRELDRQKWLANQDQK